mmetsp:Transcript_32585/g.68094  ORF Transcript_32585/g.68094 Transcript_32585/m.68094 type:complete len:129 (-) Transcript_32585:237-623(-)
MTDFIVGVGSFVMGVLYPSYMSFKAIRTKDNKEDDTQWLTYWVIYSLVQLIDSVLGFVLIWIPFFSTLKLLATLYLVLPQFKGSLALYVVIEPKLAPLVDKIEVMVESKLKSISAPAKPAVTPLEKTQ